MDQECGKEKKIKKLRSKRRASFCTHGGNDDLSTVLFHREIRTEGNKKKKSKEKKNMASFLFIFCDRTEMGGGEARNREKQCVY